MLKKAIGKVEVLEVDGSQIYAIRPDKSTWDNYTDELFDRDKDGNLKTKSGRAIKEIYRTCVKRITNVQVEGLETAEITDPNKIVEFLSHIDDVKAGQKIDGWLLGLGDLTKEESKNSDGEQSAS
jgi:hypothetical protein